MLVGILFLFRKRTESVVSSIRIGNTGKSVVASMTIGKNVVRDQLFDTLK